jgi:hypothetical protein
MVSLQANVFFLFLCIAIIAWLEPLLISHIHSVVSKIFLGLGVLLGYSLLHNLLLSSLISHFIQTVYPILSVFTYFILHWFYFLLFNNIVILNIVNSNTFNCFMHLISPERYSQAPHAEWVGLTSATKATPIQFSVSRNKSRS